jgi:CrcB protein
MPDMHWRVLTVISAGAVLGALARYALTTAFPAPAGRFDWAVFGINVAGCFAIGIVVALAGDTWLLRPFLAAGVLGGFTTFSSYIVGIQRGLDAGAPRSALLYAAVTAVAALGAAWAGSTIGTALVGERT